MIRDILETLSRLVSVFRRRQLDQDFEDEFSTHIDLLTEQNERRGLPRHEARRQAILQMGGLNPTKDLQREARGLPPVQRLLDMFQAIARDMVHAARSLAKTRSFTVVCVLSLGIGMGTFVALVTLVRGLREPAPGVKADGLVEVVVLPQGSLKAKAASWAVEQWSYPDFTELRHADTGMAVTGWAIGESQSHVQRPEGASSVRVPTMFVTANYFSTIGVSLARGPGFDSIVDDAALAQSAEPHVVLGYDFWQNVLGSDPDIVGKTITFDDVPHVVVGVAPDGYRGHLDADSVPQPQIFVPLERHPRLRGNQSLRFNRDVDWVRILGRLSPGVGIAQANSAVSTIVSGLAERYPATNQFKAASVEPYWTTGPATVLRTCASGPGCWACPEWCF
jgi:MacB-like periplasmic core domain